MKKVWWIALVVLILLIILLYFFYPLCGFHRIGSRYSASDGCNTCGCSLTGSWCTLLACYPNPSNESCICKLDSIRVCNSKNEPQWVSNDCDCKDINLGKTLKDYLTEGWVECPLTDTFEYFDLANKKYLISAEGFEFPLNNDSKCKLINLCLEESSENYKCNCNALEFKNGVYTCGGDVSFFINEDKRLITRTTINTPVPT